MTLLKKGIDKLKKVCIIESVKEVWVLVVVVRGVPVVVGADIKEGRYIVYLSPDSILEKYGEAISFTSEIEALYEAVRYVNMLGEEDVRRLREENIKYGFRANI